MKRWLRQMQLARAGYSRSKGAGYTITEVLIVLAVSTLMFVAIAVTFRGRQASTEFVQAARNYESELQNVINEVNNGYYSSGFRCTAGAGGPSINYGVPRETGTNEGCIFLGKMVTRTTTTESTVDTIVGLRYINVGGEKVNVENYAEAQPLIVTGGSISRTYNHTFQMEVRKIILLSDGVTTIDNFAFLNNLSSGGPSGNSNRVKLYHIGATYTPLPDGVIICLKGQNDARGELRLGENSTQTGMILDINTLNAGMCQNA